MSGTILKILGVLFVLILGVLFVIIVIAFNLLVSSISSITGGGSSDMEAKLQTQYKISYKAEGVEGCEHSEMIDKGDQILSGYMCAGDNCTFSTTKEDSDYESYYYYAKSVNGICEKKEIPVSAVTEKKVYTGNLSFGKDYLLGLGLSESEIENGEMITKKEGFGSKETQYGNIRLHGHVMNYYFVNIVYDQKPSQDFLTLFGVPVAIKY